MNFLNSIHQSLLSKSDQLCVCEVNGETSRSFSIQDLNLRVSDIQAALLQSGFKEGDRAVIWAKNSFEWVAADLAILFLGGISVPVFSRQTYQEVRYIIRDASASFLFLDAFSQLGEEGNFQNCKTLALSDIPRQTNPNRNADLFPIRKTSVLSIIYTSGTSGQPKGVMLHRDNFDFMLEATSQALSETIHLPIEEERVFHYLPVCFAGSRVMMFSQLMRRVPLYFSGDITNLQTELKTVDPHYFMNVPTLLERMRRSIESKIANEKPKLFKCFQAAFERHLTEATPKFTDVFLRMLVLPAIRRQIGRSLRFLICGSAPLSKETQEFFHFLGIPVLQVYGLTETTAIVSMDKLGAIRSGYVGTPLPGVKVALGPDQELMVEGPNIFPGYHGLDQETEVAMKGSWFHTGDMADIDETGRIRILGRLKNHLVLNSGHNVNPEEIEASLVKATPGASDVCVLGHGRPTLLAIFSGDINEAEAKAGIEAHNKRFSQQKKVHLWFISPEPFTSENGLLTANMKMKRSVIEEKLEPQIEETYARLSEHRVA